MEPYRQKIRQQATKPNIEALFHFTNIANLKSIIDHGLMSRAVLDKAAHIYAATDNLRLDGRLNTVSLSVSDANHPMFASKRQLYPQENWVVLLLKPEILWIKDCRFCERSAASREMTSKRGAQAGPESFRYLFIDDEGNDHGTFPARDDAEVLVYDQIETRFICGAWTDRMELATYVQEQLNMISDEDLPTFLSPFERRGLYGW